MLEPRLRFTLDGSPELEQHLADLCQAVEKGVDALVPRRQLEGLVLGGGYGRGQGGVIKAPEGDRPYNDLEFYVFLRGVRLWNEARYSASFQALGERLSHRAGLHVEFKLDSLSRLRRSGITMFSYDLVSGHRIISGQKDLFRGCEHHLRATSVPPIEATRLLFNRCTGLLLAKERLNRLKLGDEDTDFVTRNLAKAKLALGDALLAAFGQYHWNCLERLQRLRAFSLVPGPSWLPQVKDHHRAGVEFKLHPGPAPVDEDLAKTHREICALALEEWLWLESRRLQNDFLGVREYALSRVRKCPETASWRNFLLTAKIFGPRALFARLSRRYPRERLLNTLPLFLSGEITSTPELLQHAQTQLNTRASDWAGLISAYKRIWAGYG